MDTIISLSQKFRSLSKVLFNGQKSIIYARVSGNAQKNDLDRQTLSLKEYVKKEFTQVMWLLKTLVVGRKRIRKGLETNRVSYGKSR